MRCFSCDDTIALAAGDRILFRDTCDKCNADLHVCRNCEFHDPTAYNECRESSAERVGERERANRCDYFSPGEGGGGAAAAAEAEARSSLDDLFKK